MGLRIAVLAAVGAALVVGLAGGARAGAPVLVSSPSITGVAMEGEQLEAQPGTYAIAEPPFSFVYQWQRCNNGGADCTMLGVTGPVYTVTAQDIGFRLRTWVSVTGQDCGEWRHDNGTRTCVPVTVEVPSEQTPVVVANPALRPRSTAPPTISGTPEERATLTAADGGWEGAGPITTARQWERCDTGGNACAAIEGATAATYMLGRDDVAHTLRVVVTASNPRGAAGPVSSAATAVVKAFLPRPGRTTIGAALVDAPEKLVVDRTATTPARVSGPFTLRVRVSDTRGFRIRGAVVRVAAAGVTARDAPTGADGWAKVSVRPTVLRGAALRLVVRAFRVDQGAAGDVAAQKIVSVPLR